ncbi:type II toxin-antitoxin system RelE/ParE family toxin [Candidatus Pacearchaeota archaeon]|nr:type II toxin-antitoxin system RelE/ParE family toxin [Candidatus Pacearchaeota archaeon]
MFDIMYSSSARKFLKNSEKIIVRRIFIKIKELAKIPIIHDSKRLKNENLFRVRVGKFRILYEVDYKNNILGIVRIDKRGRVYD